jgi:magnesium transporter
MAEVLADSDQGGVTGLIDSVIQLQQAQDFKALTQLFDTLEAAEIAHVLESLPDTRRAGIWKLLPEEIRGEVLAHLGEVARLSLVENIDRVDVVYAASGLETQDLADVIETLPEEIGEAIRESLDYHGLRKLEAALAFPEESAGRLMDTEAVSVRADVCLETVLRYLRRRESLPDHTTGLMVVDRDGRYQGELPISALLTQQPDRQVVEVMDPQAERVRPEINQRDLAVLFSDHDLVSVAVVDEDGLLIGRVTIDDIVDIIQEEADHQILGAAGLNEEEDLFAPVIPSAQRRALWLGINLSTAFLAAWVIGLFEATLDKVVALAVLMPIVASMGGIAGSQTLTLIIRGLALGQISSSNARWLAYKEIAISALNGITWALVVGVISFFWFNNLLISGVLGAAMVINLLAAAFSGVVIPLLMERFGIDPALAGSVVLTTVTDVVGFMSFLGLATLFLL